MENQDKYKFPKSGINKYVVDYIRSLPDLKGKKVLDIPCGDGRASYEFMKNDADIVALDLFPDFLKIEGLKAKYADLSEKLPIKDGTIDYIICQEGIEHIPSQLNVLQEFNRVLKKDGVLLITTPNNSHVRRRLSHFLIETDHWQRMPPTEIDSIWFAANNTDKLYYGHYFLLSVQHFQSLLDVTGFKVKKRILTRLGNTSLIFGTLLYPVFTFFTLLAYFLYQNKNPHVNKKTKRKILWERVKLNLSPKTLFCRHIFWEIKKKENLDEVIVRLREMHRK